ncbi:MAG: pyridoxamine 5'-phosphate oxidase [Streptosporangiales bacterium]|nr:pyridoxamine 5'-phosphate oxidase [Streptosporangiales bacterium]
MNASTDPAALRRAYALAGLSESDLAADPMTQFDRWFGEASAAREVVVEPNAMVVATADAEGRPSSRSVLLKGYDERGFVFYTNYRSRKAREIEANPRIAATFPWYALERQVLVYGDAERVSREESIAYFALRPKGSQLGAWASEEQSAVVVSREVLEERYAELQGSWPGDTAVPLPEFWGGYLIVPSAVEFWQGRGDRMHDRLRYVRESSGWRVERLAP